MVFIFRPRTSRIRIFECPHRLSDKLLKSRCDAASASPSGPDITHPSATRQQSSKLLPVTVRLACVRPAASVQSEP
ncbi:hypothetical protein DXT56_12070 [Salmonella enterica subsp. enterica]|nr:hypothetical protein DXT56_12070 [Salmonella enterica subsp. enterica]